MTQKILTIAPLLLFAALIPVASMFAVFGGIALFAMRYYEEIVIYDEMETPTNVVQAALLVAHIGVFFFAHFTPETSAFFADVPNPNYCVLMRMFIMLLLECAGLALLLFLKEAENTMLSREERRVIKVREILKNGMD